MRKISLVFAMIMLFVSGSVLAQKTQGPIIQPNSRYITVQDDGNGGYLRFDPITGKFQCNMCEYGYTIAGVGTVKIDGCNVYLTAVTNEYRMFVTVNKCESLGKASVEVFADPNTGQDIPPIAEVWSDANLKDSTTTCTK